MTKQQLIIDQTPTDDLTMEQMHVIAEPFDLSLQSDEDIIGDILADYGYME